jgi:DNA transformation protein and related proteins
MDADGIAELFEPVGRVTTKRMFGGLGVYLRGRIIAITFEDVIFMKTDAANRPLFVARGSRPFSYDKGTTTVQVTSYWALPDTAFDDQDELKLLAASSFAASERSGEKKPRKAVHAKPIAASGSARPKD